MNSQIFVQKAYIMLHVGIKTGMPNCAKGLGIVLIEMLSCLASQRFQAMKSCLPGNSFSDQLIAFAILHKHGFKVLCACAAFCLLSNLEVKCLTWRAVHLHFACIISSVQHSDRELQFNRLNRLLITHL